MPWQVAAWFVGSAAAFGIVGEVFQRNGLVAERRRRGAVFKVERGTLTTQKRLN